MILEDSSLEHWLEDCAMRKPEAFPRGDTINYFTQYTAVKQTLATHYHSVATSGASAHDGGLLTDHGPKHIETVVRRASDLVQAKDCSLHPYEVYLLLFAIHLHDVGNMFGRAGHEVRSIEIIKELGKAAGLDHPELRYAQRIAQAHGGDIRGDKDTIAALPSEAPLMGRPVHPRLLAAILRLADELSDDRTRASLAHLDHAALPTESEIYHKYAAGLHSVMVDHEAARVTLHFEFSVDDFLRKFGKGPVQVYLLDEIFARTLKTHFECVYCSRYMRGHILIETVSVEIAVSSDWEDLSVEPRTIAYRLQQIGYPAPPPGGIHALAPELNDFEGLGKLTGEAFAAQLKKEQSGLTGRGDNQ